MSVAKSYAQALFEAANANNGQSNEICNQVERQLDEVIALLEKSKEIKMALFGPVFTAKEKVTLIEEVSKKAGWIPLVSQFLVLLARKGRLSLIEEIREAFASARLLAEGGIPGRLVAADPVGEQDIEGLAKAFSQKFGKRVAFRVSTDPSLLAGMKVTVNGVTYDGTLRSQLQRLRDRMTLGVS